MTLPTSSCTNAAAPQPDRRTPCQLLALPDGVLAQVTSCCDWFEALSWSMTCHRLHEIFEGLQPPVTVLDCDVTRPKFQTKVGSVVPLIDIFQFEWDGWAEALMKNFLRRRASLRVGQGLAKLFRAWTHTEEARTWQRGRLARAKIIDFVRQGGSLAFETVELSAEQDQGEYWECHLSIPNLHWDTSDAPLQKHFTTILQPLVDAVTEFANTMQPNVPHVSVFISNYDDSVFWPKYAEPPPWTCHSQLYTMCTCGNATAECALKLTHEDCQPVAQAQSDAEAEQECEVDFESQRDSESSDEY